MRVFFVRAVPIFAMVLCSCKGVKIQSDFFAQVGSSEPVRSSFTFEDSRSWSDRTSEVDLAYGVDSPDFYKTKAKYEFLKVVYAGLQIDGDADGSMLRQLREGLETVYAEAKLGNPISRARIDSGFEFFVREVYPKDNPFAQYNLGILYENLRKYDEARRWFKKSSDQGLSLATEKLQELDGSEAKR